MRRRRLSGYHSYCKYRVIVIVGNFFVKRLTTKRLPRRLIRKLTEMGAGGSIPVRKEPTSVEFERHVNFDVGDSLTVFVEEMIARCPKTDALSAILESELGLEAFTLFLRNE